MLVCDFCFKVDQSLPSDIHPVSLNCNQNLKETQQSLIKGKWHLCDKCIVIFKNKLEGVINTMTIAGRVAKDTALGRINRPSKME